VNVVNVVGQNGSHCLQFSMHSFWPAGDNVLKLMLQTLIGLSFDSGMAFFPHNQCNLITKAAQAIRHVKQPQNPEMQIEIDKSPFLWLSQDFWPGFCYCFCFWLLANGNGERFFSLFLCFHCSKLVAVGFLVKVSHKCMQLPRQQQQQQQQQWQQKQQQQQLQPLFDLTTCH